MVKLQRGRAVLLSEPGPNPSNENSAVAVDFQVPRCTAKIVHLVHKRGSHGRTALPACCRAVAALPSKLPTASAGHAPTVKYPRKHPSGDTC